MVKKFNNKFFYHHLPIPSHVSPVEFSVDSMPFYCNEVVHQERIVTEIKQYILQRSLIPSDDLGGNVQFNHSHGTALNYYTQSHQEARSFIYDVTVL